MELNDPELFEFSQQVEIELMQCIFEKSDKNANYIRQILSKFGKTKYIQSDDFECVQERYRRQKILNLSKKIEFGSPASSEPNIEVVTVNFPAFFFSDELESSLKIEKSMIECLQKNPTMENLVVFREISLSVPFTNLTKQSVLKALAYFYQNIVEGEDSKCKEITKVFLQFIFA